MSHGTARDNGKSGIKGWMAVGAAALAVALSTGAATAADAEPRSRSLSTTSGPVRAAMANAAMNDDSATAPAEEGAQRILLNKSRVLQTRMPYKRVSVAQPEIADVNPLGPTSLLVTARKVGSTQVIVWDDEDRSQVIDVVVGFDLAELREVLARQFPGMQIEATSTGNNVMLRGRVPSLQVSEQVAMIAGGYTDKVMNFLEVSGGQQVMLQVRFAEVSKSANSSLGFSGAISDGTFTFASRNGPGGSPQVGWINQEDITIDPGVTVWGRGEFGSMAFEYFLSALRQNNLLRVLAEPNLVTMSGQKASFLAGGEFPIPVPQEGEGGGTTITVEYKEFGVRLNFVPIVLGEGRIRLEVAPEVSDLDFTNAVLFNGFRIPALTTRNVHTTVELNEGQTLAIAGLLNNRVTANKEAVPLLGDIPVLGALFRSTRYERRETELVVLVTPFLVEGMNPDQVSAVPGQEWRHPREVDLLLMGDLGGPVEPATGQAPLYRGRHGFAPAAAEVE
jgi:pilus assembly protein CpaC